MYAKQIFEGALCFAADRRRMPGERIAQHLSELAPTDVGDHINIHVNVNINGAVKRICSHRLFKFSYFVLGKRFSLPQIAHVDRFVP